MKPEVSTEETRENISLEGAKIQELIRGEYFSIDKLKIEGSYTDNINSNFKVLSILDGNGKLFHKGIEFPILKGDTYFIPAEVEVKIEGQVEILKSYL